MIINEIRLSWIKLMPVEITANRGGSVAVANRFGKLRVPDATDSIRFAFGRRQIEASQDRVIKIDPNAELYEFEAWRTLGSEPAATQRKNK